MRLVDRRLLGVALGLTAAAVGPRWSGRTPPAALAGCPMRGAAFGSKSTAREVVDALAPGRGLAGRVAVVTGGNTGLGLETVKALSLGGCRVVLACRDPRAGQRAVQDEVMTRGLGGYEVRDADIVVKPLDLADLDSVAAFAKDVLASEQRVDYLVLNAGVMALPELTRTTQGFEMQMGVNHFGHALLTRLLRPKLEAQDHESRIVVLASTAHKMASQLDVNDLHYRAKGGAGYSAWGAYGASKLANVLFAKALARRLPADGRVKTTSVHPGVIRTNLWRSTPASNFFGGWLLDRFLTDKDVPQGSATTLWACLSEEAGRPESAGQYLADCALAKTSALGSDHALAERLWDATEAQLDAALAQRGLDRMGNAGTLPKELGA